MAYVVGGAEYGGDLEGQVPAGVAPLRELFARVCRPVATPDTQGAFYRNWRLTRDRRHHVRPARHKGELGGIRPSTPLRAR